MFNNQSINKKLSKLDEELTTVRSKLMLAQNTLISSPQTALQTHRSEGNADKFTTPSKIKQPPSISTHLAAFISQNNNFRHICDQKSKTIELEAQKQLFKADKQIQQLQKRNLQLKNETQKKQKMIYQLYQTLAQLREQLKDCNQKLEKANEYIKRIDAENSSYRKQNTQIKLQNKNVKADNKILSGYMDRLQRQAALKSKTEKQQFQQKQKRIIKALYEKSFTQFGTTKQQDLNLRNQLSNKIMLDKTIKATEQNILMLRKQIISLNEQLQFSRKEIKAKDKQIQNYKSILSDYKIVKQLNFQIEKKLKQYETKNSQKYEMLEMQNKLLKEDNQFLQKQRQNCIKKAMYLRPGKIYNKIPSSI